MSLEMAGNRLYIELDYLATLAIAMLLYFFGRWLCRKIPLLTKYCIPAAIVGGTAFAFVNLLNHQFSFWALTFDTSLQIPAMAGFFACTGLGIAKGGVRRSVRGMGIYFVLCVLLVIVQNVLSVFLSLLFGINPALGLMTGSTSMVGGHGTAISFGQTLVSQGILDAAQVGTAAATFGLVSGSAIGGPLASLLLRRKHVRTPEAGIVSHRKQLTNADAADESLTVVPINLFKHIALVAVIMGCSSLFASLIAAIIPDLVVPPSVAAILLGILFGYTIKRWQWMDFDGATLDLIGELMLLVFLTESSMSLQLWELFDLALPLVTVLIAQVAFVAVYSYFVIFPLMSKALANEYEATVISAAICGHGLGATPNAMANMDALTDRYGPAPNAYLIVPLAGGFLIDLVNIPLLLILMNLLI